MIDSPNENKSRRMILVVDDDPEVAETHARMVQDIGYSTIQESDPTKVEAILAKHHNIELVLLDIRMPVMDGLDVLRRIKLKEPQIGVVMATVINDIAMAVKAVQKGAYNYLLKPLQKERLQQVLESYLVNRPQSLVSDPRFRSFITAYPPFEETFRRVKAFAENDVTVLIQGETGTGKELIAQIIHSLSNRNQEPFIVVNTAALSPTLFESELFGHCKGAFTGAIRDNTGLFAEAGKGTLVLDEIGDLDLELQKKLLRVLQTHRYCRLGETMERTLEARVVLATNRNLRIETQERRFREDLYYRLAHYAILLPPLRDRLGDVEVLTEYFLRKYCSQFGRSFEGFEPEVMAALLNYPFPGNVRELEGLISGAVLIEKSRKISFASFPHHVRGSNDETAITDLERVRQRTILKILAECKGNQTHAAKKLGISRPTLNRFLKEFREQNYSS